RPMQIEAAISPNERAAILGYVLTTSGGSLETTSFVKFLHWWALRHHTSQGLQDYQEEYQFVPGGGAGDGESVVCLSCPVQRVVGAGMGLIRRTTSSYTAARVVCTIPLNVPQDVSFIPPLDETRAAAIQTGHVNGCTKLYAEVNNKELRSWDGINYPYNNLIYANAVGATPAGYPTLVCFGPAENGLQPEEDVEETLQQVRNPNPEVINVRRLVFHNWVKDPYTRGAWFYPPPGLLDEALGKLRQRHGNVVFASADWPRGWRGFIDGAIEDGTRAAMVCSKEL
ncbi:flavin monoamine oxidase family protein, partial [Aspergillus saccharolyticus JOP 1030-1]